MVGLYSLNANLLLGSQTTRERKGQESGSRILEMDLTVKIAWVPQTRPVWKALGAVIDGEDDLDPDKFYEDLIIQ